MCGPPPLPFHFPLIRECASSHHTSHQNLMLPLWGAGGRNSEVPGECSFLSGKVGAAMTRGIQGDPSSKFVLLLGALKHVTAYSLEVCRFCPPLISLSWQFLWLVRPNSSSVAELGGRHGWSAQRD